MARVPDLKPEEMNDDQREIANAIAAARDGAVRGPFALWLRNPALARNANEIGNFLREGTSVPRHLSELAILVTARHWTAQYEWFAHEKTALRLGISEDIVEAIRHRKEPNFKNADEAAVYAICSELYEKKSLSDETYKVGLDTFGQTTLIELITIATFYAMIAMILVAFEAPVPEGEKLPLPV